MFLSRTGVYTHTNPGLDTIAFTYLREVRNHQPHGDPVLGELSDTSED